VQYVLRVAGVAQSGLNRAVMLPVTVAGVHYFSMHQIQYGDEFHLKLFVCEFVTGGGLYREPLPASLLREGEMMRDAVWRDFSALPDMQLVTTVDIRLPLPQGWDELVHVAHEDDVWAIWQRCIQEADMVLPIAPEQGGCLLRLTQMVEQAGKTLLACYADAVALFGDKWRTFAHLRQHQIPTPDTFLAGDWLQHQTHHHQHHWIAKPIDGAGCEDMLIGEVEQLKTWLQSRTASHLVQPFLVGESASFCMLCYHGKAHLMSCNRQHMYMAGGRISLSACELNAMQSHADAFALLARQIALSMPNLRGYVGVDVQIQQHANKLHYWVLDINPRLTTSYVGLHQAIQINPAHLLMMLHTDAPIQIPQLGQQVVNVMIGEH
jgi:predicted ATP-grasp superfamily ATP-dependent carboligase